MSEVQIHPTAIVDAQAEIDAGTIIGPASISACASTMAVGWICTSLIDP